MTDQERVRFFFDRLAADPNMATAAVMLAPIRALDPVALAQTLDALAAHWAAANNAATVEAET